VTTNPSYGLQFLPSALKEWRKLDATIQSQFKKKLAERLANPKVAQAALSGMPNCYKIKLRTIGYRLVYEVQDTVLLVTVVAVGKRDLGSVYALVKTRVM
jgi:mRNA interferase RelE/StbE